MNAPIPKHESVIDFSPEEVKSSIVKFSEINLGSDFYLKEKNDIFGNYVFTIFKNNSWNGLSSGSMHITVNSVDDTKTKITVETLNTGNDQYVNVRDLTESQNDFLRSLSNILSGNEDVQSVKIPKGG